MAAVSDQRRPRVDYRVPVLLRGSAHEPAIGTTLNVSERGAFVGTAAALDVGDVVTCQLLLYGEQRALRGRVAWRRDDVGAGIEFVDLSRRDTELLRKVVKIHDARPGGGAATWVDLDADDYVEIEVVVDANAPQPWADTDDTERVRVRRRPIWPWVALIFTPVFAAGAVILWPADDPTPTPPPRPTTLAPPPTPTPAPTPAPAPAPALAPTPAPAPAPAPALDTPTVTRTARAAEVVIPIAGNIDGGGDYRLADPDGVAINLPHARARVALDDYTHNADGVTVLSIRERDAGIQIRVHFSSRTSDYTVAIEPDTVRVTLDLDW